MVRPCEVPCFHPAVRILFPGGGSLPLVAYQVSREGVKLRARGQIRESSLETPQLVCHFTIIRQNAIVEDGLSMPRAEDLV